jgi:hypothetical protein
MLRTTFAVSIGLISLFILAILVAAVVGYSQGVSAQQGPPIPLVPSPITRAPAEVVLSGDNLGFMLDPGQERLPNPKGRFVIRSSDGRWVPVRISPQIVPAQ